MKLAELEPVELSDPQRNPQDNNDLSVELRNWLDQQKVLKERIQTVCEKYGSSLQVKGREEGFMFEPKHQILYCKNAKVNNTKNTLLFLIL